MAVSTRTEYALRALLEIPTKECVSTNVICERQNLPKRYVVHILRALKNAGLILSSPGSLGGYTLARPLDQISLYDIMDAVDDRSMELDCERGKQFCLGENCGLKPIFSELAAKQRELFQNYSLSLIAKRIKQEKK